MELVQIYQGFSDPTRLRLLQLLARSPLCVCHLQAILGEPQVKISKHLAYLRDRGMVEAERDQNWMIYSLPEKRSREFDANLKCLQECTQSEPVYAHHLKKLTRLQKNCCDPKLPFHESKRDRRRYGRAKRLARG